jgi:hypothetical protein
MATLLHLQRNTDLLLKLMQHLDCLISDEELRAVAAEKHLAQQVRAAIPDRRSKSMRGSASLTPGAFA